MWQPRKGFVNFLAGRKIGTDCLSGPRAAFLALSSSALGTHDSISQCGVGGYCTLRPTDGRTDEVLITDQDILPLGPSILLRRRQYKGFCAGLLISLLSTDIRPQLLSIWTSVSKLHCLSPAMQLPRSGFEKKALATRPNDACDARRSTRTSVCTYLYMNMMSQSLYKVKWCQRCNSCDKWVLMRLPLEGPRFLHLS